MAKVVPRCVARGTAYPTSLRMPRNRTRPRRAVVTGGAGFIGSHLVDALLARGDEVLALDDLSSGRRENLADALAGGAALEQADIRDAGAVRRLLREWRPDVVFHLAAQADVSRSVADPDFDAQVNRGGTVNVLEAARAGGAFNIGAGSETSVKGLLDALAQVAGAGTVEPEYAAAREGEVRRSCLDAGLAARTLGFAPAWSLEDGLRTTFEAYARNLRPE